MLAALCVCAGHQVFHFQLQPTVSDHQDTQLVFFPQGFAMTLCSISLCPPRNDTVVPDILASKFVHSLSPISPSIHEVMYPSSFHP